MNRTSIHGSCAGSPTANLASTASLRRPRFFAGQLLTEDDLGLLDAYVVAKNRLHNRHLFGDGVVCGLRVFCQDCDRTGITVEAGYALDCCGNDIVVPCATDLDMLALIRDLRLEHGGASCGDPCVEGDKAAKDGVARTYCLYLRYDEKLEDPVAPYATDQTCDGPCEPTRIAEGYRFELRCGPHEPVSRPDVLNAIRACFGDLPDLGRQVGRTLKHQQIGTALTSAQTAIADGTPYFVEEATVERLGARSEELNKLDLAASGNDADSSYRVMETVRVLRQNMAVLAGAEPKRLEAAGINPDDLRTELDRVEAQLIEATERIPTDRVLAQMAPHDRTSAAAVLRLSDPEADEYQAQLSANMMKSGVAFDSTSRKDYSRSLSQIREWLLIRLEKSTTVTSCRLRDEVLAIRVDVSGDVDSRAWSVSFKRAAVALAGALFAYLIDCVCAALNPPCPACDDEAVLLACIEVEDCEVVDICNQVRTYVLAPTSFRYWFGTPIRFISQAVEFLCCEFSLRLAYQEPKFVETDRTDRALVATHYVEFQPPSETTTAEIAKRVQLSSGSLSAIDSAVRGFERTTASGGGSPLEALGLRQLSGLLRASTTVVPLAGSATEAAVRGPIERVLVDQAITGATADEVVAAVTERVSDDIDRVRNQLNGFRGSSTRLRNDLTQELRAVAAELAETRAQLADHEKRLS